MKWRKGFLLLWVQMASCLLLILGGSVFALAASAARAEARAEETAEMTLIAEEAVETMKYDACFGGGAVPAEAERNGRRYRIASSRFPVSVGGAACMEAAVTVTAESGAAVSFCTLLGPADGEAQP